MLFIEAALNPKSKFGLWWLWKPIHSVGLMHRERDEKKVDKEKGDRRCYYWLPSPAWLPMSGDRIDNERALC